MKRLKVNEENLLELLTTKLYSTDPNLTIRELLQNASDAINEVAPTHSRKHSICVEFDGLSTDRWISITDTGIGMNAEDLEQRLAVVADGDKVRRAEMNDAIAGRFGIGFLSTLIIADEVEVLTRKAGDEQSWRFILKKNGEYSIEESAEPQTHGTKVILKVGDRNARNRELTDKISDLLTKEGMKSAIQEWGYLLKFPVQIKDKSGSLQVNARVMPWQSDQAAEAAFEDIFGSEKRPIFTHCFQGINHSGVTASGVIYFNSSLLYKPTARLYSRGLLIDSENASLMPDYASFAFCIVECSQVEVDLARRNAEQNANYRALSNAIWAQFSDAFLTFGRTHKAEMRSLWSAVDNSITSALLRLLNTNSEKLKDKRAAAAEFAIKAAPYLPFHTVDEVSGAQGRPLLRTISELVSDKRNNLESHHKAGEPIDIYYTDSRVPVEKNILITQHGVLIDVSREEKAHAALLRFFQQNKEEIQNRHQFRLVPAIMARPQEVSEEEVRNLWRTTLDLIQQSIHFYQRQHEVLVEKFVPTDTPIIVGLEDIDDEAVTALREALTTMGPASPQTASLIQKVDHMLSGAGGNRIQIRVNADNTTMRNLARAALNEATKLEVETALRTIVWRAVLDYFGFNATRQMIEEERSNVNLIVTTLLNRAERLSEAQEEQTITMAKLASLEAKTRAPQTPKERFVGVIDIQDSTRHIFGVNNADPNTKANVLEGLLNGISEHLKEYADVSGFTGDGIQFLLRENLDRQNCTCAGNTLRYLSKQVSVIVAANPVLKQFFANFAFAIPQLRIAVDYGLVFETRIAGRVEAYGSPFIRATRMVSQKALYKDYNATLIVSRPALNEGAQLALWDPAGFSCIGNAIIKGLVPEEMPVHAPTR